MTLTLIKWNDCNIDKNKEHCNRDLELDDFKTMYVSVAQGLPNYIHKASFEQYGH